MSSDEEEDEGKNDSRKILPKINWNEKFNHNNKKSKEIVDKVPPPNLLYFNEPKQLIRILPINFNLINLNKSFKLNKKIENDEIEKTTNFNQINSDINKTVNNEIRNIILDYELKRFLNSPKHPLIEMKSKSQSLIEKLNSNNIFKMKYNNSTRLNKQSLLKNKLIAIKLKDIKVLNKENPSDRKYLRNDNKSSIFNRTSIYMSLSNETVKSNGSMINVKQPVDNIDYREKNENKLQDSINAIESKIFSSSLNKKKKLKEKEIFISKLNIKSSSDNNKKYKNIKLNNLDYKKKWDLPKSFSFAKLIGRKPESKNLIKFHCLERLYEYSPKYDSVLSNGNKAYIQYNPDSKKDFNRYKKFMTRKFICNHMSIVNNPGNNYNIMNLLNEIKLKKQKIINKKKLNKILEEFIYFNKKRYN